MKGGPWSHPAAAPGLFPNPCLRAAPVYLRFGTPNLNQPLQIPNEADVPIQAPFQGVQHDEDAPDEALIVAPASSSMSRRLPPACRAGFLQHVAPASSSSRARICASRRMRRCSISSIFRAIPTMAWAWRSIRTLALTRTAPGPGRRYGTSARTSPGPEVSCRSKRTPSTGRTCTLGIDGSRLPDPFDPLPDAPGDLDLRA